MHIGTMLVGIAVLHLLVGGVLYARVLQAIASEGVLATVVDFGDRAAAFWFVITGLTLLLLGVCIRDVEARGLQIPAPLAPGLALLTLAMVLPMPATGAWCLLPVAWLAYRRHRVDVRTRSASVPAHVS